MILERYRKWKDEDGNEFRPVSLDGQALLNDRILNKGTAFSVEERDDFHLRGLLPPRVQTFDEQIKRVYMGYQSAGSDIQKYHFLRSIQDMNETLFYKLLSEHIEEMTPIIYTPTVGMACQQFSHRYRRARGLYITPYNVDHMGDMVNHFPSKNIKIIVVTDSQGVLGIGDQGVGGMGISIGKLSLYTLGAGIHPSSCLPVVLDIGTDNLSLLTDPMYLGIPHKRIRGAEYDDFISEFIGKVTRFFPNALLQWEDFSKSNAFNNLITYKERLPSFNDDIQGTGAVVLAGIINACKIKKEMLDKQIFLIYGAGAGGIGVADQILAGLMDKGLDAQAASDRIFVLDSQGLILDNRRDLEEYKRHYAKPARLIEGWKREQPGIASLTEVINNVPVTVLLGTSGMKDAFTEGHVQQMLKYTDRPVIFPLSNPTNKSEAVPADILRWSQGRAIISAGSPFGDIDYEGKTYRVGQGNNVFIFPGVGLASILTKIKVITPEIFTTASCALAECVSAEDLAAGNVYPRIKDLREITFHVAMRVIRNVLHRDKDNELHQMDDLEEYVRGRMWTPEYLPYRRV